ESKRWQWVTLWTTLYFPYFLLHQIVCESLDNPQEGMCSGNPRSQHATEELWDPVKNLCKRMVNSPHKINCNPKMRHPDINAEVECFKLVMPLDRQDVFVELSYWARKRKGKIFYDMSSVCLYLVCNGLFHQVLLIFYGGSLTPSLCKICVYECPQPGMRAAATVIKAPEEFVIIAVWGIHKSQVALILS
ncbi:unnamed protein product, partial [Porites lobata]